MQYHIHDGPFFNSTTKDGGFRSNAKGTRHSKRKWYFVSILNFVVKTRISSISTSQKVRDGYSFCFYRPLEKAERRRKKNRKKKEKKKERKKAQKQNEGSPGENQLLVLSLLSARFSLLIAYVSNNLGSKRVTFMQLSTTISNRK